MKLEGELHNHTLRLDDALCTLNAHVATWITRGKLPKVTDVRKLTQPIDDKIGDLKSRISNANVLLMELVYDIRKATATIDNENMSGGTA
jgi:hypothetical protein